MRCRFLFLVLLGLLSSRAHAWESEGHQAVAYLAQRHLTPRTSAAVSDLLDGADLASVALWADDIKRGQRPETRPWHYVLIPNASLAFDEQRDCAGRACVVDKIGDLTAVLSDAKGPRQQRVEALKFLVHFVADPPPAPALR